MAIIPDEIDGAVIRCKLQLVKQAGLEKAFERKLCCYGAFGNITQLDSDREWPDSSCASVQGHDARQDDKQLSQQDATHRYQPSFVA
ncbi:MAG: hypothetical protein WBO37_04040 [Gammaproteobacteria bacterium]